MHITYSRLIGPERKWLVRVITNTHDEDVVEDRGTGVLVKLETHRNPKTDE